MSIFGKFKLVENNNYDKYLQALGVNFFMRKLLTLATPVTEVTTKRDDFIITTWTTFKTKEIKFKHLEEFDEITGDGRHCKSSIYMHQPHELRQIQKWDDKQVLIERIFEFGEKMTMKLTFGDVVCTRVYTRFTVNMVGKYRLIESTNYDEYLEALGVDLERRKTAVTDESIILEIEKVGDKFIIATSGPFKRTVIKFQVMEQFDEKTADGRECKSVVTYEYDDTLIHIQWCNDKQSRIERKFEGNRMTEKLQIHRVYCTRVFTKIQ